MWNGVKGNFNPPICSFIDAFRSISQGTLPPTNARFRAVHGRVGAVSYLLPTPIMDRTIITQPHAIAQVDFATFAIC